MLPDQEPPAIIRPVAPLPADACRLVYLKDSQGMTFSEAVNCLRIDPNWGSLPLPSSSLKKAIATGGAIFYRVEDGREAKGYPNSYPINNAEIAITEFDPIKDYRAIVTIYTRLDMPVPTAEEVARFNNVRDILDLAGKTALVPPRAVNSIDKPITSVQQRAINQVDPAHFAGYYGRLDKALNQANFHGQESLLEQPALVFDPGNTGDERKFLQGTIIGYSRSQYGEIVAVDGTTKPFGATVYFIQTEDGKIYIVDERLVFVNQNYLRELPNLRPYKPPTYLTHADQRKRQDADWGAMRQRVSKYRT